MTSPNDYIKSLNLANGIINRETKDLSHEDSMKQLPFPANCLNWNLGHILVYRMQYLGLIDGQSQPDEAEFALYGYGSEPLTDSDKAIPLPTILERLDAVSEEIVAALQKMPPEKLTEVVDAENGITVDDRLRFYLIFHEAFHLGQVEILREMAQN